MRTTGFRLVLCTIFFIVTLPVVSCLRFLLTLVLFFYMCIAANTFRPGKNLFAELGFIHVPEYGPYTDLGLTLFVTVYVLLTTQGTVIDYRKL